MPLKLDSLPIEIIQRIASSGPCESALTLLQVNRCLNGACNERHVFKAILKNRNGYDCPNWDAVPLSNDSPTSSWARYALADSRAGQWATKDEEDQLPLPPNFSAWAPQLLSCSHPFLGVADPINLYTAFEDAVGDDSYAQAFCLTLRMLSTPSITGERSHVATRHTWIPGQDACEKLEKILYEGLNGPRQIGSGSTADRLNVRRRQRTRAIAAVAIMCKLLRSNYTIIALAANFSALLDLPLPFSPGAAGKLATCHLSHMTSPQYLEDGVWTGFYSTSLGSNRPISFDQPMHNIRFTTNTTPDRPRTIFLKGNGRDSIGYFDLGGGVCRESGLMTMTKRYVQRHEWHWGAYMTPFGIVGTWGQAGWGGWLWLYKES